MTDFSGYSSSRDYEVDRRAEDAGTSIFTPFMPYLPAMRETHERRLATTNDADTSMLPRGINQPYSNPVTGYSPIETLFRQSTSLPYDQGAIQIDAAFLNNSFVGTSTFQGIPSPSSSHSAHTSSDQMIFPAPCGECHEPLRRPLEHVPIPDLPLPKVMISRSTNVTNNYLAQLKVGANDFQTYKRRLRRQSWFGKSSTTEEPPLSPDDLFVHRGYVSVHDPSRFCWLICKDQTTGLFYCRIDHKDSRGQPCRHSVKHIKDAKAHISEYFEYRPYVCEGTGEHQPCPFRFPTKERRNDHYSKKNGSPDERVKCTHPRCRAKPMLRRNLGRHLEFQH